MSSGRPTKNSQKSTQGGADALPKDESDYEDAVDGGTTGEPEKALGGPGGTEDDTGAQSLDTTLQGDPRTNSDAMMVMIQSLMNFQTQNERRFASMMETQNEMLKAMQKSSAPSPTPVPPDDGASTSRSTRTGNVQNSGAAAKVSVREPKQLEESVDYANFVKWRETFDNYRTLIHMDRKERSEQLSLFWNLCSQDFLDKVRHVLNIKADTNLDLNGVLNAIAEWLKEKRDLASARYKLVTRKNEANELIDDWFCVLKQLALEAGLYEMTPDDWLATLIVCGHSDGETQLKLLEHKPLLNLEDTLKMCRSIEASKQHQSDIKKRAGRQIGAVGSNQQQSSSSGGGNKSRRRKKGRSRDRDGSPSPARKCFDCDKDWPHPKETPCSAKDHKCKKCDTVGHFERCCGNRKGAYCPHQCSEGKNCKKVPGFE